MIERGVLEVLRDVAAGVVQQRQQVPRRVGAQGVLEVDHADAGRALARRQPQQIFGMIVAVDEDAGAGLGALAQRRPQVFPFGHGLGVQRMRRVEPGVPFDEQVGAGLQGQIVIGQQRPSRFGVRIGQHIRRGQFVQLRQGLDGREVQRQFVLALLDQTGEQAVAQVLADQKAVGGVDGVDFRRAQALGAQEGRGRGESLDAAGGQARHGIIAGSAAGVVILVRPARHGFQRRRLIHQHEGRAVGADQSFVAACRGVARQRVAFGVGESTIL